MAAYDDEQALDLAFAGQPFVQIGPADDTTLDLAFQGQPFTALGPAPVDVTVTARQAQSSSASASVSGTASGHRYWRIYITAVTGTPHHDIMDIEFRTSIGGANVATGGTPIYSNQTSGFEASKAFDGSTSTCWYVNQGTYPLPQWIGYDFGSGNVKDIAEFTLQCWSPAETPSCFELQYSDDNVSWTRKFLVESQVGWAGSEKRAYSANTGPSTAASKAFWRLRASAADGSGPLGFAEMKMMTTAGGSTVTTGGTPYASCELEGTAASVFNSNVNDHWNGARVTDWIGYKFASAVNIVQVSVTARNDGFPAQAPKDFVIEYWDGTQYVTAWTVTGSSGWTSGQTRTFTNPAVSVATSQGQGVTAAVGIVTDGAVASAQAQSVSGTASAASSFGGGGGGGTAPHRYWRVLVNSSQIDPSECDITEVFLNTVKGGPSEYGGTASASSSYAEWSGPDLAFDADNSTAWNSDYVDPPHWIQYDFGEGNEQSLAEWGIQIGWIDYAPSSFILQSSDDGVTWTDEDDHSEEPGWPYATLFWDIEPTTARYWRVYVTADQLANGFSGCGISQVFLNTVKGGPASYGGTASADSTYSATYSADKPFDGSRDGTTGDTYPYWKPADGTYPHWLQYDFGAGNEQTIVEWGMQTDSNEPSDFELQYSSDGVTWTTVDSHTGVNNWQDLPIRMWDLGSTSEPEGVTTRQGQSTSGVMSADSHDAASTSQAQSAAGVAAVGDIAVGSTAQAQKTAATGPGIWNVVRQRTVYGATASSATLHLGPVASGHAVVVQMTGIDTTDGKSIAVTDSSGNVYTACPAHAHDLPVAFGGEMFAQTFYCNNVVGSATDLVITGTVTMTGSYLYDQRNLYLHAYEVQSPLPILFDKEVFDYVADDNGNPVTGSALATAGAGGVFVAEGSRIQDDAIIGPSFGAPVDRIEPRAGTIGNAGRGDSLFSSGAGGSYVTGAGVTKTLSYAGYIALDNSGNPLGTSNSRVLLASSFINAVGINTSQAQSSSGTAAVAGQTVSDSTAATAQAQHATAGASAVNDAAASTRQAQGSSALAQLSGVGSGVTAQAQGVAAQADVASTASVELAQAQQATADAGVSLDADSAGAQVQGSAGQLRLSLDATIGSASVQSTSVAVAAAYVLDAATAQAQQADAQAGVDSPVQGATGQRQSATAQAGVSADTSAATDQRQSVRVAARAEVVNTVESGQVQRVTGVLGLSSDVPTATYQAQTGSAQAGVAADMQVVLGQTQHIGDGNLLVVGVDAVVSTAQDRQSARGALVQYVPKPGSLSLATHRMHPVLAGTTELQTALDAPTRVRPVLSGRADLRPD